MVWDMVEVVNYGRMELIMKESGLKIEPKVMDDWFMPAGMPTRENLLRTKPKA